MFLAPWAWIIGGLIAVPVLISLYLLKLRRNRYFCLRFG